MSRPDITVATVGYVFQTTRGTPGQRTFDLVYSRRDPYVAGLRQRARDGEVLWEFARDLLADGVDGYAGLGDIRIWPGAASHRVHIGVAMTSHEGRCALWLPRAQVESFLARTFRLVPRGKEKVDVDAVITRMLPKGWVL